jgi:hypothetical protein
VFELFAFLVLLHVARAMVIDRVQDDSVLLSVEVIVSMVKYDFHSVIGYSVANGLARSRRAGELSRIISYN